MEAYWKDFSGVWKHQKNRSEEWLTEESGLNLRGVCCSCEKGDSVQKTFGN